MPRLHALTRAFAALAFTCSTALPARPQPATTRAEAIFLAAPSAAGALATSRAANARAHYAGTPGDYAFATYMRDRLAAAGFDAKIEAFRGPIDRPRGLGLAVIGEPGGPLRRLDLREGPVPGDPAGTRSDAGLPFNYGSGSGDVRAPLVVVGRGLDADYATLRAHHASVRGRIAIVRYGAEYRGLLAARAQRNGAAGVIFYSDPRDDATRPDTSVQRGMVTDARLRIPTLPVTLRNARVLLAAAARGGSAELSVDLVRRTGTMWNTVGVLRGSSSEEVVLGGHRDAWVYGVTDNGSGIATLLEVAHAFGAMAKAGYVPHRTIVICGFDAEEIGELGSISFVRSHGAELSRAVAYLNADEVVTGATFGDDAVAAIAGVVTSAARRLGVERVPNAPDIPGGGSDHESFLYAPGPGIPTAEVYFGGRLGTYHSAYDDLHYALAADPGFERHRRIAQVLGLIALRLSETPQPYRFTPYARQMRAARAKFTGSSIFAPLDTAIAHFAAAAAGVDTDPGKRPMFAQMRATREIDRALYGAAGYGNVAFPAIREASLAGKPADVGRAAAAAAKAIDAAANLLSPPVTPSR